MRIIRRVPKFEAVRRVQHIQKGSIRMEAMFAGRPIRDESIPWLNQYGFVKYRTRKYGELVVGTVACLVLGGFIAKYLHEIYRNEQRAVKEYRIIEVESSPFSLYFQRVAVAVMFWLESRIFITRSSYQGNPNEMDVRTEGVVRTLQYRNYKKYKDRRMDFGNLGVMEKFPFPRYNENLERIPSS